MLYLIIAWHHHANKMRRFLRIAPPSLFKGFVRGGPGPPTAQKFRVQIAEIYSIHHRAGLSLNRAPRIWKPNDSSAYYFSRFLVMQADELTGRKIWCAITQVSSFDQKSAFSIARFFPLNGVMTIIMGHFGHTYLPTHVLCFLYYAYYFSPIFAEIPTLVSVRLWNFKDGGSFR